MPLTFNDNDEAQALDQNEHVDRWQYSVRTGCTVSPGTNSMTVQCASGEIYHDGTRVSVAAQDNVGLNAADSTNPRKDTVYLDSSGTLQVATGTAESAKPSGNTRFQTYRPAPPDLDSTKATVVAEVWIAAGASDITSSDVRDRRQLADHDALRSRAVGQVHTLEIKSGETIHVASPDNQQLVIPSDRSYDVDGTLKVDGSFVLMTV